MYRATLLVVCGLLISATGFAGEVSIQEGRVIPKLLNYQGYITDTLGIPINDSLDMTFKIFDAVSSGNELWSESQVDVSVERGVFSVILGESTAIQDSVFSSFASTWLELTFEGPQTLTPRTRITAVGYAYTSTYSDTSEYARNSAADNDWVFLISDGADTTLQMGGQWGLTRPGNVAFGNADSTHVNFGIACTTGMDGYDYKYCTVSGGYRNTASGNYSSIGGGYLNTDSGGYSYATIAGGTHNKATGSRAAICGGYHNTACYGSFIGGGAGNIAHSSAVVGGGVVNTADSQLTAVVGGEGNIAYGKYSIIGSGYQNSVSGWYGVVCGGRENVTSGEYAFVGSGYRNEANADYATVTGGQLNVVDSMYATIAGGMGNDAINKFAFIGGGASNYANGTYATVAGGYHNSATANCATTAGGYNNHADSAYTTVCGGDYNRAMATHAAVCGGYENWVSGDYSVICGGYDNTITSTGDYSYLFGIHSELYHDSTFMVDVPHIHFGDMMTGYEFPAQRGSAGQILTAGSGAQLSWSAVPSDADWVISGNNQYSGVSGNVGIGTSVPLYKLDVRGVICGGTSDAVTGVYGTVLGGYSNIAGNATADTGAAVCAGYDNSALAKYSFIGGGRENTAYWDYATVGGGYLNYAKLTYSTVAGGRCDTASSEYTFVGGGFHNVAWGLVATVAGGSGNRAQGNYSMIGGGHENTVLAHYGGIFSGYSNDAGFANADTGAIVCGGRDNRAIAKYAFVGGGRNNGVDGDYSVVSGGGYNWVGGSRSAVMGGNGNDVYSDYSVIPGGMDNEIKAGADYSCLIGISSELTQDSTFMVDMPHIRFGDETDGYEFPVSDGSVDQILVTNGSGQLVWADVSANDTDWVITGSDQYSGVSGNVGIGTTIPGYKLDVHGVICGGESDTVKAVYGAVLGGYSNLAGNVSTDTAVTVTGGWNNTAMYDYAFVGGGIDNGAYGWAATIAGGSANHVQGPYSGVLSGFDNTAGNSISLDTAAIVVGGRNNSAEEKYSFIGGGFSNYAHSSHTVVGGGYNNSASHQYAAVCGGYQNTASGQYSAVTGGYVSTASHYCATVSGGRQNSAQASYGAVCGGFNNTSLSYGFVGGGYGNTTYGGYSTVSGGDCNETWGEYAAVGGGGDNYAEGDNACIPGGYADTVTGAMAFAANANSDAPYNNSAAFNGQVTTATGQTRVGALSKASGTFTIDHPLDPEHKILNHYFVESPEMVLIYRGSVVLDADGKAEVHLPDYFDALNKNPMVQLTGVGSFEIYVAEEVKENRFAIAGKPGTKVYWTVTSERKDQSAKITKIIMPVEQPKDGDLAGRSLDDDFLCVTMEQLEQMGKAGQFQFRTAAAQKRYEDMKEKSREQ
jgi:hypothetical protein